MEEKHSRHFLEIYVERCRLKSEFEKKMREQQEHEERIKKIYLESVPEELGKLFQEVEILDGLFEYGHRSFYIYFDGSYGFWNFQEASTHLRNLEKAWNDSVKITIYTPEPHRVQVLFECNQQE